MASLSPRKAIAVLERRKAHLDGRIAEYGPDDVSYDVKESRAIETACAYLEVGIMPTREEGDGLVVQRGASESEAVRVLLIIDGQQVGVVMAEWDEGENLRVTVDGKVVVEAAV